MIDLPTISKEEIYTKNFEYLLDITQSRIDVIYSEIIEKDQQQINYLCLNDDEVKEYFINQFNEVRLLIQNETNNYIDLDDLLNFNFNDENVTICRNEFQNIVEIYLDIETNISYNGLISKELSESEDPNLFRNAISNLHNFENLHTLTNIAELSLKLKYYRSKLNDQKEIDDSIINKKGLPEFSLLQRYFLLDKTLEINNQIIKLKTSKDSISKLLAMLLGCSVDNARKLINDIYPGQKKFLKSDKDDEVNEFIERLKIK